MPKDFSFINIAFDYSIRQTLIDNDYKSYNQFINDYDSIEEIMTELLLKNKKLLNDNIIQFVYLNEDFNFENNDIISKFNETPGIQTIDLDDKIILYEFYDKHHEDINLFINIIHDFIQLIMFINNNRNNSKIMDKIAGKKEISNVFEFLDDKILEESEEFKSIFENKKNLTINKISNLFIFYLRLIFHTKIKDEFINYQISEDIEENKVNKIKKYFTNEKLLIGQGAFRSAIRLFITLYLYKENKEEKIKKNNNNVVRYLNIKDVWVNVKMEKKEFKEELKEIKKLNIKLNEILPVYNLINYDKDDDEKFLEDVIKEYKIKKKEKENVNENPEKSGEEESEKSEENDESEKSEKDDDNEDNKSEDNKSEDNDDKSEDSDNKSEENEDD